MKRKLVTLAVGLVLAAFFTGSAFAGGYCPKPPPPDNGPCNSGRGNGSEGNPAQLIVPSTGSAGIYPTVDCDPGNSGDQNRGGD